MIKRHYFASAEAYCNTEKTLIWNGYSHFHAKSWLPDTDGACAAAIDYFTEQCGQKGIENFRIHLTAFNRC